MISKKFEVDDEVVAVGASPLEIAKIQIESAIEMLFQGHHPLAVHAVAEAGLQIVRDLASDKELPLLQSLEVADVSFDSSKNFAGIRQDLNDVTIFWAIQLFDALGGKQTAAMHSFYAGVVMKFPELASTQVAGLTAEITAIAKKLTREEFLRYGAASVQSARARAEQKLAQTLQ
ncbi:hypothetical protein [Bdellovibrio sp. HCB2-146]|uniref:hypothetical protein n=1 Tax=Bdellovibrio sp. HCB2-146 TaxID=3394362 RepID=UPI0039BC2BD5